MFFPSTAGGGTQERKPGRSWSRLSRTRGALKIYMHGIHHSPVFWRLKSAGYSDLILVGCRVMPAISPGVMEKLKEKRLWIPATSHLASFLIRFIINFPIHYPIGSMYAIYGNMDPINIHQMLAYIPYMDPMGYSNCYLTLFGVSKNGGSPKPWVKYTKI